MSPRIILAGNNLAAVHVLELLVQGVAHSNLLVIAPPENDRAPWQASLAEAARTHRVKIMQPGDVNSPLSVKRVATHRANFLLSVYYTQLFRPAFLHAIDGPALNFHPSLLPRHRGVAPLVWSVLEGDELTGLTVHHIDEGIDTGPIVYQHPMPIHPRDTGHSLHLKMDRLVRARARTLLRDLLAGRQVPPGYAQVGETSSHRRSESVSRIRWEWAAARVRNVVRALAPPLAGAFTLSDGHRLVLAEVTCVPERCHGTARPPGTIEHFVADDRPYVWAADGLVRIDRFLDDSAPDGGSRPGWTSRFPEHHVLT